MGIWGLRTQCTISVIQDIVIYIRTMHLSTTYHAVSLVGILTSKFLSANEPSLDVHPTDIPIITAEQEPLQHTLQLLLLRLSPSTFVSVLAAARAHAKFCIEVRPPHSRVACVRAHAHDERIERLPRRERAHARGEIADLRAAERREVQQGCDGQLAVGKAPGLRGRFWGCGLQGHDFGAYACVLDGSED